ATRETPGGGGVSQPVAREGQAGLSGESEGPIVPEKPANVGGGKGPWFKVNARSGDSRESGVNLVPPTKAGKSQAALPAQAKRARSRRLGCEVGRVTRRGPLSARDVGPTVAPAMSCPTLVGESMRPCPRAACGKSARPVR